MFNMIWQHVYNKRKRVKRCVCFCESPPLTVAIVLAMMRIYFSADCEVRCHRFLVKFLLVRRAGGSVAPVPLVRLILWMGAGRRDGQQDNTKTGFFCYCNLSRREHPLPQKRIPLAVLP